MPVAHHFAFVRDTVRSHPVIVATTAATGGVLLGAFVAFQVVAPPRLQTNSIQAVANVKPAVKPAAETSAPATTGSASSGDTLAAVDCDQQTWPNLSRTCMEQVREKSSAVRAVTPEKPAVAAIETAPPAPAAEPIAQAPAVAAVAPPPQAPVASVPAPAPSVELAVATPEPAPTADVAPQTPAQAAVKALKAERAKNKTKIKGEPKAVVRRDFNENDDGSTASYAEEDRDADDRDVRPGRRFDRSRRGVERGTEREYVVRSEEGDRRVIVIRRGRGGGLFENLFGVGRDDD